MIFKVETRNRRGSRHDARFEPTLSWLWWCGLFHWSNCQHELQLHICMADLWPANSLPSITLINTWMCSFDLALLFCLSSICLYLITPSGPNYTRKLSKQKPMSLVQNLNQIRQLLLAQLALIFRTEGSTLLCIEEVPSKSNNEKSNKKETRLM